MYKIPRKSENRNSDGETITLNRQGNGLPQVGIKMETEVGFEMYSDDKSVSLQCRRPRFNPWVGKMPWRKKWQPTPVLLLGKSHGQRSLVGYSPRGHKELDTTE